MSRPAIQPGILRLTDMDLLLLGLSSLARRRILPAAVEAGFERIEAASRSAAANGWTSPSVARIYPDYCVALAESHAQIVYISTVNSLHAELAEAALRRGFHVIVDKPAFLSLADARRLLDLAAQAGRCLAEATVWQCHPRVRMAMEVFRDAGSRPTQIAAAFSMPPLAESDFRYRAECGGGALWDLGPYAMTPGRVFFGVPPSETMARATSTNGSVDTAFSLLSLYPEGRSLTGFFGYTTGYINRLQIAGPGLVVNMDRVFSPPAALATELSVSDAAGTRLLPVPATDNFALFLGKVVQAISTGDHAVLAAELLEDAEAIDALRRSALSLSPPVTA